MVNVGYFTHSNISPSETFIYDLVKALNSEIDINLTYVSGQKESFKTDFDLKSISTNYVEKNIKWAVRIYKLGQIQGERGLNWKMRFRQYIALKQIQKSKLPAFDVAYVEYATSAVLLMKYFAINKIPFIVHVHGYDITSATNDPIYKAQMLEMFKHADTIITPSKHIKRVIATHGCSLKKIKAIYPITNIGIINEPDFKLRKHISPTVIFLGRLTPKKNPLALIFAFSLVVKQIPNAILKILGDGELRSEIESLINELELNNNIKLYGVVDRTIAFNNLRESNIYAQHSVTSITGDQEGFPVSLAEAAAHGLPIVSTIHSGITENVIEGKTGFLVQEYDYETMAEKIIYLIKNPNIAEQMGKAGREHILKLCRPNKRIEEIKKLILKAASQEYKKSI